MEEIIHKLQLKSWSVNIKVLIKNEYIKNDLIAQFIMCAQINANLIEMHFSPR